MRRFISILFILVMILSLVIPGYAQSADLMIADVEANPGDTVYLTVELKTELAADALGLSFTYDDKILEPLPAASWSWGVKGAIKNFDIKQKKAVWGANESTLLSGDICVMAFKILEKAKLTQTKVTCELIVKNQGAEVGVYSAEGIVGKYCEHQYNKRVVKDQFWHTTECTLCGKVLTQSHMWDDGQQMTINGKTVLRFTCTECHHIKDTQIIEETNESEPVNPENPNEQRPTAPSVIPNQNGNDHKHEEDSWDTAPTERQENHEGHDHQENDVTISQNDSHEENSAQEHDHVHTDTITTESKPATGIVVAVALVVILGAAVYFAKKK